MRASRQSWKALKSPAASTLSLDLGRTGGYPTHESVALTFTCWFAKLCDALKLVLLTLVILLKLQDAKPDVPQYPDQALLRGLC